MRLQKLDEGQSILQARKELNNYLALEPMSSNQ